MEVTHGLCTKCGQVVVPSEHQCTDDIARLVAIDREAGPRKVREALLALGQKGYQNEIETLEAEAMAIRENMLMAVEPEGA